MTQRHAAIMGMMGAGKTTVGRLVAARLGWDHRDSDDDILALTGTTGADYAVMHGVDALHDLEAQVLLEALEGPTPTVIGAAGWTVEAERCRSALRRRAFVVWLELPTDELLRRLATGDHRREVDPSELHRLLTLRAAAFGGIADLRLDATRPPTELADEVVERIAPGRPKEAGTDADTDAGTDDPWAMDQR